MSCRLALGRCSRNQLIWLEGLRLHWKARVGDCAMIGRGRRRRRCPAPRCWWRPGRGSRVQLPVPLPQPRSEMRRADHGRNCVIDKFLASLSRSAGSRFSKPGGRAVQAVGRWRANSLAMPVSPPWRPSDRARRRRNAAEPPPSATGRTPGRLLAPEPLRVDLRTCRPVQRRPAGPGPSRSGRPGRSPGGHAGHVCRLTAPRRWRTARPRILCCGAYWTPRTGTFPASLPSGGNADAFRYPRRPCQTGRRDLQVGVAHLGERN